MKLSVSRYTLTSLLLVALLVAVSPLLERAVPFVLSMVAFPMNLVLMALWLWGVVELYRRGRKSAVAGYLLSTSATVTSIVLLVVGTIIMGLQQQPQTTSALFLLMMLFVLTQLTMVTLRGWRNKGGVRWLFTTSHLGLLLVLIAGFWGAPDNEELRVVLSPDAVVSEAYSKSGDRVALGYQLSLVELETEYYDTGVPSLYRADVLVDGEAVTLKVNHPHRVGFGEHLYLISMEGERSCVMQIVIQPWRGVMFVGILLLILGAVIMFFRGPKR